MRAVEFFVDRVGRRRIIIEYSLPLSLRFRWSLNLHT